MAIHNLRITPSRNGEHAIKARLIRASSIMSTRYQGRTRMKKPTIPADHKYSMGVIAQSCPACDWENLRLKQEKMECPNCGAKPRPPILKFGGMEVSIRKDNQFEIHNPYLGSGAIIEEADLPDTIVFLMKNSTFWFNNDTETEEHGIHAEKLRRAKVKKMIKKARRHLYLVKK